MHGEDLLQESSQVCKRSPSENIPGIIAHSMGKSSTKAAQRARKRPRGAPDMVEQIDLEVNDWTLNTHVTCLLNHFLIRIFWHVHKKIILRIMFLFAIGYPILFQ